MTIENNQSHQNAEDSYISAEEFFGEDEAKARKAKALAANGTRKLYYYKPYRPDTTSSQN